MCSTTGCNLMILEIFVSYFPFIFSCHLSLKKPQSECHKSFSLKRIETMIMIPSARMAMLLFSRVFCIICFSFYIHVCLLIAVGVWIILGSSWTMPRGKPQAAGRYHNVTFSVFHHQLGFVFLFYYPDQHDTLSSCHGHFQLWFTKYVLFFLFSFFFSLVKKTF